MARVTSRPAAAAGRPGKYLSLTTYRRDGTPVSTPVWFVEEHGRLCVTTAADSYKAKRLRRSPAAMVAPCTARGIPKGDAIPVRVEFLPPDEHARVDRLMAEKYRLDRVLILPIYRLAMKLRGKPVDERGGAYWRSRRSESGSARVLSSPVKPEADQRGSRCRPRGDPP